MGSIQLRVVSKNVELAGKGRVELDLVVYSLVSSQSGFR